jgi:hypothetical protein
VSRHVRDIEKLGVPAIAASAANVVDYAVGYDFKYGHGMPVRYVAFPFPVAGQPRSVHRQYIEGEDQLSGKPMMTAIIDGLTRPLTEHEKFSGMPDERDVETEYLTDSEANLRQLFKDREWTDYYPLVLPTAARVQEMLTGTSHPPDEVIKVMSNNGSPGGARPLTVEKVAVYAVMAGAGPEYMPLLLALATRAPFGNSTTSMANTIIVNGPIRKELGLNAGTNAMGPYNEANTIVGRTFTLISKIAGDLRNGISAFESQGSSLQYNNLTLAENEEALPQGWDPLHVQMGYQPTDSVVTIGIGWSYISSLGEVQGSYPAHLLMRDYMRSLAASGSAATLFVDPSVAGLLRNVQGFESKSALSQWFSDNVEKTVASYWGNGVIATSNTALALQGLEPYASWKQLPDETLIKPFTNPGAIHVVVVGGGIQTTWFATDFRLSRGVLVDEWR